MTPRTALLGVSVCFSLGVLGAGCNSQPPTGQVTGRVLYQNKPLASGTVTFLAADGKEISAEISPQGIYKVSNVPVGLARIGVVTNPRVPPALARLPGQRPPPEDSIIPPEKGNTTVEIPSRYHTPKDSNLFYDVQKGSHEFNIELTSKP